jgi:hypothetical protein
MTILIILWAGCHDGTDAEAFAGFFIVHDSMN